METIKRTFMLGLMLGVSLLIQAQMTSSLTYRRFTTQDGLPQMQAERVWQDSRGYIYIGTLSGFVRFDGRVFTPFLKGRRTNIVGFAEIADEVRALGFFRQWTVGYDDLKAQPLTPQGHWLLNNLNAGSLPNGIVLLEDSLEQNRRLCRMTENGFEALLVGHLLDEMTPDRKIFTDSVEGTVIPTEKGLYRIKKGARRAVRLSRRSDIFTLLRKDTTLLAFASDGIYSLAKNGLRKVASADWSATNYGLTVRALRSGSLVIADEHAVYLYDGTGIRQIFSGINLIRDLLIDRWDRLWVASYQGIYCFFNQGFTNHVLSDENDIVRAVALGSNGQLVMGTLNGKIILKDSTQGTTVISDDPEQFYAPSAASIGQDVYMAGNGDIVRITGHVGSHSPLQWLGLPHDRYQFVAKAWDCIITGGRHCIFSYDPKTNGIDTLTTDILHPWCAAQADSLLWIGSSSGLFSITKNAQVSKTDYTQKLIITTMDADSLGNIIFASADSLFLLQKGRIKTLNPEIPELSGHEVRSVHISPRGYLAVAVVDGLFVCHVNRDYQIDTTHFFNHQNGFTMTEPLKAMMAETSDGTVWLAGVEQMTSFRPSDLLAYCEEDTIIVPPLRWWQHWWVWLLGLILLTLAVWAITHFYEKRLNQQRMIRLQREKLRKEQQIAAIRQKAINDDTTKLARDIVKMTEQATDERLTFRTASGTIIVEVSDIAFFKGEGNYSQRVTFHDKDIVLMGLGALEKILSPETFVRADRSTLVNIHNIYQLLPKQRRCIFRSTNSGLKVETILLAPAFKRLSTLWT